VISTRPLHPSTIILSTPPLPAQLTLKPLVLPLSTSYKWPVPSKLLASLLVASRPISNSLPSHQHVSLPYVAHILLIEHFSDIPIQPRLPQVVSRSIVSTPEPLPFVKSDVTRSQRNSSFANSPSNVSFVNLHKISYLF
jgi:hypothetical protein